MSAPGSPQREKLHGRVVAITVGAALGGFLFGFDTSVINGAVDAITDTFRLGTALTGFAVSSALLGCALGAWFAGVLSNHYGRVRMMLVAAALFLISSIGSGSADNVTILVIFRFVGGLGVGAASVIAPAYIAEVSPAAFRGRLASLQQLAIGVGIFVALLTDAVLADSVGSAANALWFGVPAWRWMFFAEAIPALVYGVYALFLPESPRFLVHKGRGDEAERVLRRFTGAVDPHTQVVAIQATLGQEEKLRLRDLRGHAWGLKPVVWIGILLSVFQQFVGINVIAYYSTMLWQSVGFDESHALTISVITQGLAIVVCIVSMTLVDKAGRRILLLCGSLGMAVALALMAFSFSFASGPSKDAHLGEPYAGIALVASFIFSISFGLSWGPLVWVLLGEIFPNGIRTSALAVAVAAQWLANFVITTTFPSLASVSLTLAYGLYAAFALTSFFFVLRRVPETKGRTLEEADDEMRMPPAGAPPRTGSSAGAS